jgi:hypothetical protein
MKFESFGMKHKIYTSCVFLCMNIELKPCFLQYVICVISHKRLIVQSEKDSYLHIEHPPSPSFLSEARDVNPDLTPVLTPNAVFPIDGANAATEDVRQMVAIVIFMMFLNVCSTMN